MLEPAGFEMGTPTYKDRGLFGNLVEMYEHRGRGQKRAFSSSSGECNYVLWGLI